MWHMIKSKMKLLTAQREVATGKILTYESLGAEIGSSKNTLNRLAERQTDLIDFLTLDKLCRYIQCDIADLLSYEPDKDVRQCKKRSRSA